MKRIDPKEQFSKKLATWTARFWFFYMLIAALIVVCVPQASNAAVYLAICASVIMLVNVWAYTHNSVYEKAILAGMDKIKLTWRNGYSAETKTDDAPDVSDEDEEAEEGGNG